MRAWDDADRSIAQDALRRALKGVGDPSREQIEVGDYSLNLRRLTTPDEARRVKRRPEEPVFPIERA